MRIDLNKGTANILISDDETGQAPRGAGSGGRLQVSRLARRPGRRSSARMVGQMGDGMVLETAGQVPAIAQTKGMPRDNH